MIDEAKEKELKKIRKWMDYSASILLIMGGSFLLGYKPDVAISYIYTVLFAVLGGGVFAAAIAQKHIFSGQNTQFVIRFDDAATTILPVGVILIGMIFSALGTKNQYVAVMSLVVFITVFMMILRYLNRHYKEYGMKLLYEDACVKYRQTLDYDLLDDKSRSNVDAWLASQSLQDIENQIKEVSKLVAMKGPLNTYKFFHE